MFSPLTLLFALIALTALAAAASQYIRRRRATRVAALAARWQMHYAPDDRFHLGARVAHTLPVAGAADVVVKDLIYGDDRIESPATTAANPRLRYVFTIEYTLGVIRGKRRHVGVGTLTETRGGVIGEGYSPVTLAPSHLSLLKQYEHLAPASRAN
jgi:hypothetical protein